MSIRIKEGESKTLKFTITYVSSGSAVDCSAYSDLNFKMKQKRSSTSYDITKALANFTVADAATGVFKVTLTASETGDLEPGNYIGEFEITFTDGSVEKSPDIDIQVIEAII